jgi:hypothetical protein
MFVKKPVRIFIAVLNPDYAVPHAGGIAPEDIAMASPSSDVAAPCTGSL